MAHLMRCLQVIMFWVVLGFTPSYACEHGYQQWHASRDVVCLSNKMISYLTCLESTGAGQINIEKDDSGLGSQKFTVGLSGEGNGPLVHGKGKIHVDTSNSNVAIHQIKQQFDPTNSTNCLKAAFGKETNEAEKKKHVVKSAATQSETYKVPVATLASEPGQHHQPTPTSPEAKPTPPTQVIVEKIVPYPIVLRRDEPLPKGFDDLSLNTKLSDLRAKFPNGKLESHGGYVVELGKEIIPFKRAYIILHRDTDNPSLHTVCLFYRDDRRDHDAIKEQAMAVFGMMPGVSRLGGASLVWKNIKSFNVEVSDDSYCASGY